MSDRNLRLQVVLNAVDKLTRPFKAAQASNKQLAQSIRQSRDELKRLNQAGDNLTAFTALNKTIKQTGSQLDQSRLKAQMMTREMATLESPTKKQTQALESQWKAVSQLETKQQAEVNQLGKLRAELYRMGVSAQDGALATARIQMETGRYNVQLKEQEQRLKRVGEQQRKSSAAKAQYGKTLELRNRIAGGGAAAMGAGVALGAPVMSSIKSYSTTEDAMKGVAKQVNGLRDDKGQRTAQYYEMQKAIKDASEQLPMENGAADFAALVEGGARMGVANAKDPFEQQKADLLNFASVSAKASKAFELPADQLAEDLGKIAFLYKIPIKNIGELGDTLNYLDDNAQSKGADIINVMQRMGDVADKLGYKQAAALGSTFLSLGAVPEVAASASKAMIRELGIASMQGKRFQQGMKALGLNAGKLEKGIATNAVGTIQGVLAKIKNLPKQKQLSVMTMLFGKEFGDDAQKLGLNIDEFSRQLALTQQGGAKGSMQRESDIDKDSLSSQYLLLKTGVSNTFSSLGETLRTPILDIIAVAKRATTAFRRWVEENPRLAGALMKTAAGVAVVLAGMGALAISVAAVLGPLAVMKLSTSMLGIKLPGLGRLFRGLGIAVRFIGTAFLWVGRMMMANPILAIIGVIAMAAVAIWQNWDTLGPKFKALWDSIAQFTLAAWEAIKTGIAAAWDWLVNLLENWTLPGAIAKHWDTIKTATLQAWDSIKLAIAAKWEEIVADVKAIAERFKEVGGAMIDSVMAGIDEKWEALKTKLASLAEYLPAWMRPGNTQVNVNPGKPATTPANPLARGDAGMGFAGMYDTGGRIPSGKFGIVGERGPEIINGPANVIGRRQTASMAAVAALSMGIASSGMAAPLHPYSLPASDYRAASPVARAAISSNQQGGTQNIFHITAAPGQSPQDIAAMVARILDERERKHAARGRSSFSDRGDFSL